MPTRTFPDRIRHAVLFELIGLAAFIPAAAFLFDQPVADMGVLGIVAATVATVWNFLFNLGFDHALLRFTGRITKTLPIRIVHAVLFEAVLVALLLPLSAWYLGITLWNALTMDLAIVAFYLVYVFVFNMAYDRVFPVRPRTAPHAVRSMPA